MSNDSSPRVLIIRALEACNAGCFMCPFAFSTDAYRFTAEDARELAPAVNDSSIALVRLTGGEPLLLPDITEIGRVFKTERRVAFSIITNGYFILERMDDIRAARVDQVIVSIDGSSAETHDRYRRLPGLFKRCREGIRDLRRNLPEVAVRVNTVVGPHNLRELPPVYDALCSWGVDQWSIIPLKRSDGAWKGFEESAFRRAYEEFRSHVESSVSPVKLLGHSRNWAGRDAEEVGNFLKNLQPMTPKGRCRLVDVVRYYTPKTGIVFPCNCVPHRHKGIDFGEAWSDASLEPAGLRTSRDWLREHGPASCRGCEPINAALGEGEIDLSEDILGF
jgi:cytosylglucuronate decarboxylase